MKVTLTKVFRATKDKQGNELVDKNGKPYTKVAIKTEEHGDVWISGFGNAENESWQEGDQIDLIIEKNGKYTNFKMPNTGVTNDNFDKLVKRVEILEAFMRRQDINDLEGDINDEAPLF